MRVLLGTHWSASAEECGPLTREAVGEMLAGMADCVGLTPLGEPIVRQGEVGWIGVLLLAESHASLHQNEAQSTVFVDLFSCVPFDAESIAAYVQAQLHCTHIQIDVVARGVP